MPKEFDIRARITGDMLDGLKAKQSANGDEHISVTLRRAIKAFIEGGDRIAETPEGKSTARTERVPQTVAGPVAYSKSRLSTKHRK